MRQLRVTGSSKSTTASLEIISLTLELIQTPESSSLVASNPSNGLAFLMTYFRISGRLVNLAECYFCPISKGFSKTKMFRSN